MHCAGCASSVTKLVEGVEDLHDVEANFGTQRVRFRGESTYAALAEALARGGYGLGRHGWVALDLPNRTSAARWQEVREWVRTSYTMVAPKTLARVVLEEDGITD